MGGLLVVFLVMLYFYATGKIVGYSRPIWGRWLILLAAILVPTADAVYGRLRLKHMCEADGGIKINKTVENVAGFYAPESLYDHWITHYGYQYVEGLTSGSFTRLVRKDNGQVTREPGVLKMQSKYKYEHTQTDLHTYFAYRGQYVVYRGQVSDMATGEILGVATDIAYYGGWVERMLAQISDAGPTMADHCALEDTAVLNIRLVTSVLTPIQ